MIDPLTERVVSLTDAAKLCPRRRAGKQPHASCMYRWTTTGCRGVVLESVQVGATRCTSHEAMARFFAALTAAVTSRQNGHTMPAREADAVEEQLRAAGL